MKVLVLGGTGFIGKHLVDVLSSTEYSVIVAVRNLNPIKYGNYKNIEYVLTDYSDESSIRKVMEGVDTIIHLIGQMGKDGLTYADYYETNCLLTKRILLAAADMSIKHFIYCSTPGVQGFGARLRKECDPYAPRNPYEKTKMLSEQEVSDICNKTGINYTILRPDFVYGPGDYRRISMYKNIKRHRFVLTVSGDSHLCPTYIDDVIQGFFLCIGNPISYGQVYNLAAKEDVTSKYYLNCIAKAVGSKLIHINVGYHMSVFLARAIDRTSHTLWHKEGFVTKNRIDFLAMDHSVSSEKAMKELGYKPQYTCEQGITETIQWCVSKKLI